MADTNNLKDTAEDVAEETAKAFTKPTALDDIKLIVSTSARLGLVVTLGTAGFVGGVVTGMRLISLADRVIAKRKA